MNTTRLVVHLRAPRDVVYAALLDPAAVQKWRVPDGMTSQIHTFEAREGGAIRVSLTYESATELGKTERHTDTYRGRFVKLIPNEEVVEIDAFETADPAFQGEMTITLRLRDSGAGTDVVAEHHGLPAGVSPADNEEGWRMALEKLAQLVEGQAPRGHT